MIHRHFYLYPLLPTYTPLMLDTSFREEAGSLYTLSLSLAPQNSELLPTQTMLQSLKGADPLESASSSPQ